jgi:hypothetical protein
MRLLRPALIVPACLCLAACGGAPPPTNSDGGTVVYAVEFIPQWTRERFPVEYPDTALLHRPHFSGWVATAHGDRFRLFAAGTVAGPGLERLAETGRTSPLDTEIRAAIAAGDALGLTTTAPLRDLGRSLRFEVTVDPAHPRVAAVAMIAPSPDWFVGADVDLREGDGFAAQRSADLFVWDAGSDDGTTFFAEDLDAVPRHPIAPASPRHFERDGRPMAVGRLIFTRR